MANPPKTAADTLAGQGTTDARVYIDPLTVKQREKVARWLIDSLSDFGAANVVAIMETGLKLAEAERRKLRHKWALFFYEVQKARKDGAKLDAALIAVRDAYPWEYGKETALETLQTQYKRERKLWKERQGNKK